MSEEGYEFRYDWNGFEDLTVVFTNEGIETVKRMRKLAEEGSGSDYATGADELEMSILKYAIEENA